MRVLLISANTDLMNKPVLQLGLACVAAADDNLLIPKFYVARDLEGWLRETVKTWMETRPHWVM